MSKAYEETRVDGSSTFCLLRVGEGGRLETLTLGDCGAIVFRKVDGKILPVFRTEVNLHDINYPFQVGYFKGEFVGDLLDDADYKVFDVKRGDVVVAATDGVFDNLFDYKIANLLPRSRNPAKKVVEAARHISLSPSGITPWSELSGEVGGKPDDITAVVLRIR